jgi:hypothetical protein
LVENQVFFVQQRLSTGGVFHPFKVANMIDMCMSAENVPDVEPMFGNQWHNQIGIFTGIDQQGFTGFFTTQDVAVALQRSDGNRFENQGPSSVFKETKCLAKSKAF